MNAQIERIQSRLERGYSITPLQALRWFGCFRLGARIWDLKKRGLNIRSEIVESRTGKRFARYSLN